LKELPLFTAIKASYRKQSYSTTNFDSIMNFQEEYSTDYYDVYDEYNITATFGSNIFIKDVESVSYAVNMVKERLAREVYRPVLYEIDDIRYALYKEQYRAYDDPIIRKLNNLAILLRGGVIDAD
tara:strand:- start:1395 stop:1769 length:375 start_codon:yes stop_codon:yes gene_type:complete